MALLSLAWRHALWLAPLGFGLGVYLLVQTISGMVRTGRQARLSSVPLVARQELEFTAPGPVVLALEGPLFGRIPRLEYELVGPDGARVPGRATLFRAASSGLTRGKVELRVFRIAVPGRHALRIEGLGRSPREQECVLVFQRPHLGETVAWIAGTVLAAALTVGSAVAFGLRLGTAG